MKVTIGKFEIEAWDPYPVWCTLRQGSAEIKFSHKDLEDLAYAVKRLQQMARERLGKDDKGEVP